MKILVLDTIHGGKTLSEFLEKKGYAVDTVDVYRGREGTITEDEAAGRNYDLIVAPVHLDPDYRLLNYSDTKVISHHEAVALAASVPEKTLLIEITGARGKTTTAHAVSHLLMKERGVLHTSRGTILFPEKKEIFRKSITPATFLKVLSAAGEDCRWIVAEESIGVTGLGELGILTSGDDYPIANGKKSALGEKIRHLKKCGTILLAPGIDADIPGSFRAGEIAKAEDELCIYEHGDIRGEFRNSLLTVEGYREALMTAAAAGCILGIDPSCLGTFTALKGRLSYSRTDGTEIVDNSNSGTNRMTAAAASEYARRISPGSKQVLVIGVEEDNICEGFSDDEIAGAISDIMPEAVVVISKNPEYIKKRIPEGIAFRAASTLDEGADIALKCGKKRIVVLSVKTWR